LPQYWDDPETFNPDRWNNEEKIKEIITYGFIPFVGLWLLLSTVDTL
jgi:cytochrome P450